MHGLRGPRAGLKAQIGHNSCVTLGMVLNLSVPQFPRLQNEEINFGVALRSGESSTQRQPIKVNGCFVLLCLEDKGGVRQIDAGRAR